MKDDYLTNISREIRAINETNGFKILRADEWVLEYKIPTILALIHSEVSEALEAFRKFKFDDFIEEMADVIIRVLDCTGAWEGSVDMEEVIAKKLEKNRKRKFRHGGKKV